jgi:hypothetical protein
MIKLFEQFNKEQEIIDICKEYNIENYTINSDGSIDVDGDINLNSISLKKIPIKFNIVSGNFSASINNLTSLEGCPKEVGGDFYCSYNQLTSLEGCPKEVGGNFYCSYNQLTSLKGAPMYIYDFWCNNNQLISLEGCPNYVGGNFHCFKNKLISLEGCVKEVGHNFNCSFNQLTSLKGAPMIIYGDLYFDNNPIYIIDSSIEVKGYINTYFTYFDDKFNKLSQNKLKILFEHGVDYDIFKKDGSINDSRLERLFKDFNI